jgi:hypothetical protein
MPSNRFPLAGIHLSNRLKQQLLCDPLELSPMATAVRLRAKLLDLGYRVGSVLKVEMLEETKSLTSV